MASPHFLRAAAVLALAAAANAQPRAIDTQASVLTVRVFKSGLFSALAHDHEIAAPISAGSVDAAARLVELGIRAAGLRVRDPKDRAEIEKKMLGAEVLDAERFPEIRFHSTAVESAGASGWSVHGNLTLHGQTRVVTVAVKEQAGHYMGSAAVKQSEFGIKPVRAAGGTVRVKDEVRIEFDIQLAR